MTNEDFERLVRQARMEFETIDALKGQNEEFIRQIEALRLENAELRNLHDAAVQARIIEAAEEERAFKDHVKPTETGNIVPRGTSTSEPMDRLERVEEQLKGVVQAFTQAIEDVVERIRKLESTDAVPDPWKKIGLIDEAIEQIKDDLLHDAHEITKLKQVPKAQNDALTKLQGRIDQLERGDLRKLSADLVEIQRGLEIEIENAEDRMEAKMVKDWERLEECFKLIDEKIAKAKAAEARSIDAVGQARAVNARLDSVGTELSERIDQFERRMNDAGRVIEDLDQRVVETAQKQGAISEVIHQHRSCLDKINEALKTRRWWQR